MIHEIDGPVMPYAWGSRSALAELLGRVPSGRPEAELWLGAHPAGSARLAVPSGSSSTLAALLAADLPGLLGPDLAARYGRLPFLLKVLAIEQPLSLQAHPDLEQARRGFARENALGIDLSDPTRNYKDENHKPELILALSPVEALSGFRPRQQVCEISSAFGLDAPPSPLARASAVFAEQDGEQSYETLFRSFFALTPSELLQALEVALLRARALQDAPSQVGDFRWTASWLLRFEGIYGADPGVLAALLLNPLRLEPGEAVFLPARHLHAYLSGVGIEVMAESDNVLRGGLTPKHVDVDELCRVLTFQPSAPDRITPVPGAAGRGDALVYRTRAREFELWSITIGGPKESLEVPSPCLALVLDGQIDLSQGSQSMALGRGQQCFVSWSSDPTLLSGSGQIVLAAAARADST